MDEQATFSVTVASIAQLRDEHILIGRHSIPHNTNIFDGMAGVGGDSLSYMLHSPQGLVKSNEHDPLRFHSLHHNMDGERAQYVRTRARGVPLYLDPEWGGPGYPGAGDGFEATVDASKSSFEARTVAFQSTIAEHIGKHLKKFGCGLCRWSDSLCCGWFILPFPIILPS